ncbi:hypothetical protein CIK05_11485 [Bdellovibrio sp. qaytius]|nr:hypothetical protein CIK05_11485 [Bdellovibrio sp. qaytius]
MLSFKKNPHLTMVVYLAVHIVAASLVFGCEGRKSFYDNNRNDINLVPIQMENPDDPITDDIDAVNEDKSETETKTKNETQLGKTRRKSRVGEAPPPAKPGTPIPQPPAAPVEVPPVVETPPVTSSGVTTEASKFIKTAFWVVQNEARKIGTPCNFYVSRVLELSGYSDDGFLANDFDVYAKKHFSSYKNEIFNTANIDSERIRLKRHIWSYPARTPFIFQWERSAPQPGHIAIVERIGDQLVVYQASLNKHIARREQTTIDRLLSHARSARMTVYSEFIAR